MSRRALLITAAVLGSLCVACRSNATPPAPASEHGHDEHDHGDHGDHGHDEHDHGDHNHADHFGVVVERVSADDVSAMPFVGDTVSTDDLAGSGWTCRPNLAGTMNCSKAVAVEGVQYAQLGLQLTRVNQVKQLTMSISEATSPLEEARALATHIARLATVRGFTCGAVPHSAGPTACEQGETTLAITTYKDRGYAMATVSRSQTAH